MGNKGFDQFTAGTAQRFRAAEVRGVCLDEIGIEVVLANQEAELIAKPRLAVAGTIARVRAIRR